MICADDSESHPDSAAPTDADDAPLTEQAAAAHVHGICFKTGPPTQIGVELEWLVRDADDPYLPVLPERVAAALDGLDVPGALPAGSRLTTEPGGQLELSSQPAVGIAECLTAATQDMAAVTEAMQAAGLRLSGHGLDPFRPPLRVLDAPRYVAMEEFFDRSGHAGRIMMCSTASVQICLDAGEDGNGETSHCRRWQVLHAIGPVLVAAFANSPLREGRPTGWRSTRQAVWAQLDPGRTRPPSGSMAPGTGTDLRWRWAEYALDAELMCIRSHGADSWTAPPGLTFRDWLDGAADGAANLPGAAGRRRPTVGDLDYHLSTLFPPVRPRGHLELRMIDAQPGEGWMVPAGVVWALLTDPQAAGAALAAVEPLWSGSSAPWTAGDWPGDPWAPAGWLGDPRVRDGSPGDPRTHDARKRGGWLGGPPMPDPWLRAARCALSDRDIARAARACFEAATGALRRCGAPGHLLEAVANFAERYVQRDRCPADDLLEEIA